MISSLIIHGRVYVRDGMPVPKSDVGALFIPKGEFVKEESQFWFSRDASALDTRIH